MIPTTMEPERECPACAMDVPADAEECLYCGYEFPLPKAGMRLSAWLFVVLMVLFALPLLAWLFGILG